MRRFYVVSANGRITGEGVAFLGNQNALRWVATDGLVPLRTGKVYPVSTTELDELIDQMHFHLYWLDGMDVPIPEAGSANDGAASPKTST